MMSNINWIVYQLCLNSHVVFNTQCLTKLIVSSIQDTTDTSFKMPCSDQILLCKWLQSCASYLFILISVSVSVLILPSIHPSTSDLTPHWPPVWWGLSCKTHWDAPAIITSLSSTYKPLAEQQQVHIHIFVFLWSLFQSKMTNIIAMSLLGTWHQSKLQLDQPRDVQHKRDLPHGGHRGVSG